MRALVTGGAGFIGSQVVKHLVAQGHDVLVADRFTYAGKARNLADVLPEIRLLIGDLATGDLAQRCAEAQPDWLVHMAAETHVDRAIEAPETFVRSNVLGTTRLLQAFWHNRAALEALHQGIIYSTDEVFGSTPVGMQFDEATPFNPSNSYSASKVAVEAMANAFSLTHGMPLVIVRPCNTYGPGQHPEKVIPKFVAQMLAGQPVTIYNDGQGARDWLYVQDHARAIECLLQYGAPGTSYNLAAHTEHTDAYIADRIETILTAEGLITNAQQIRVPGRPGHDRRYWMTSAKLRQLGWQPAMPFAEGFRQTVLWNAHHQDWWTHDQVEVPYATAS